jgi:hypothetical protein
LKNEILNLDPGYIGLIYQRANHSEARASFEQKIQVDGLFSTRIEEASQLANEMTDGFSPEQVVDTGALKNLPAETRKAIKEVLRAEYLVQTDIESKVKHIHLAIADLKTALGIFAEAWFGRKSVESEKIQAGFAQVQLRAQALHWLLADLPEGIVLP